MMDKQKMIIIVLSVALFALGQYVLYEKIIESRQQEISNSYQHGYDKGITDAVTAVFKQTENCQTTSLTVGNMTKTILDFSCLKTSPSNDTR